MASWVSPPWPMLRPHGPCSAMLWIMHRGPKQALASFRCQVQPNHMRSCKSFPGERLHVFCFFSGGFLGETSYTDMLEVGYGNSDSASFNRPCLSFTMAARSRLSWSILWAGNRNGLFVANWGNARMICCKPRL